VTTLSSQEKVVNERLAKAFDSVLTFAQEKARFPLIREYCQEILKLEFNGDHSYCPIHTGHGGHAFEITDSTQKGQCWSHCRDNCPRHGNDTIDYTQPCTCRGDVLDLHMLCFEFESKREAINSLINGDGKSLPRRADKFFVLPQETKPKAKKVNERLVARIEREFHFVDRSYLERASGVRSPVAADFAQMFLEDILRPDDLPIVFFTKFEAIIGRKAVDALERVPDRLQ
jgi:hypothetical protein